MEQPLKHPKDCQNMTDIRTAIDRLDQEVIDRWALRFEYIKAAAQFKTDETAVRAPERFAAMLTQRRQWAQEQGLNPDVIEGLYRNLVTHFIEEELKHWQQHKP
ncbi:isochorismate-pyruvate lyase [Siphonobacter sp. BAB-5385]|uniref:isochorismate lyase n=1 Tax=unclassified Siphonobacter TaxID=2635712 RepID=UPI000B9E04F9|nr:MULTISPECIES: isochorismate lyase [unclassified Siphonobacter]OZI08484.1 isochorismate-pyruvate lyase [Siphonobacter sp. BAB-5385]PMD99128.1 isochorismate-pyruvate lyase [Siphonobacter sp. BAB-5405]